MPALVDKAIDELCDRLDALRALSFVGCGASYVSERMVNRYIEAHRCGDDDAGGALLCHVEEMLRWVRLAGYAHSDDYFLAELAFDEAIAAERTLIKGQR